MCNHKWKITVSYNHPYLLSKTIVCKKCELCNEQKIDNKFNPTGFITFATGFVKPKRKVYKKH